MAASPSRARPRRRPPARRPRPLRRQCRPTACRCPPRCAGRAGAPTRSRAARSRTTPSASTPRLRASLAEPVGDRLWIAGEACAPGDPGTLAGARDSGQDAAEQVARVAEPGERVAVIGAGHGGAHRRACTSSTRASRSSSSRRATGSAAGCGRSTSTGSTAPIELGPVLVPDDEPLVEALGAASVDTVPFDAVVEARTPDGRRRADPADRRRRHRRRADLGATRSPADVSLAAALVGSGTRADADGRPTPTGSAPRPGSRTRSRAASQPATGRDDEPRLRPHRTDLARSPTRARLVTGRLADLLDALADRVDIAVLERRHPHRLRRPAGEPAPRLGRVAHRRPGDRHGAARRAEVRHAAVLTRAAATRTSTRSRRSAWASSTSVWLRFDEAFWRRTGDDRRGIRRRPDRPARRAHGRRREPRGRRLARRRRARPASRASSGSSRRRRRLDWRRSTIRSSRRRCSPISRPTPQRPVDGDEQRRDRHEDHEHERAVRGDAERRRRPAPRRGRSTGTSRRRRRAASVYGSHSVGYTSTQPTVDHGTGGFTAMMLSAVHAITASAGTTKCSSVSDHGTSTR